MSDKPLNEMTFQDVVKEAIQAELDAIVQGKPLKDRVWYTAYLAIQWAETKKKGE